LNGCAALLLKHFPAFSFASRSRNSRSESIEYLRAKMAMPNGRMHTAVIAHLVVRLVTAFSFLNHFSDEDSSMQLKSHPACRPFYEAGEMSQLTAF
jgi:hypothetical protein